MSLNTSGERNEGVYGKLGKAKFDDAYLANYPQVRAHLEGRVRDAEAAADDAFMSAAQSGATDTAQLMQRTYAKTRQIVVDDWRTRTNPNHSSGIPDASLDEMAELKRDIAAPRASQPDAIAENRETLREAFSRLSQREKDALVQTAVIGDSREEAAKALRIAPTTVKTHVQRARQKINHPQE